MFFIDDALVWEKVSNPSLSVVKLPMPLSPQPPNPMYRGGEVDDGIVDTAAAKLTFCGHFLYISFFY